MKSIKSIIVLALVGLVVAAALVIRSNQSAEQSPPPEQEASTTAPAPTLVELGSDKCTSCRAMIPVLEELESTHGCHLNVRSVDVWKDPAEGERFGVTVIPTQVLLAADGQEIERHTGFWSVDAIRAAFESNGHALGEATGNCDS